MQKIYKLLISLIILLTIILFLQIIPESKVISSSEIELLASQNQVHLLDEIQTALLKAKESIYIEIFALKDHTILKTLSNLAKSGVDITLIYDKNNPIYQKLPPEIKKKPVDVKGIMHRKIVIIDKEEIWMGSMNLTKASLNMHDNLAIKIKSKEMANYIIEMRNRSSKIKDQNFQIDYQPVELYLLPNPKALERVLEFIDSSEKSLKIAMFTWTHPKITKAVINAKKRGVKVEIVIEKTSYEAEELQKKFLANNINAKLSSKNVLLHHKLAIKDDKELYIGSANWTRSAFTINEECFIIVHDLNTLQQESLNSLWYKIDKEAKIKSY